MDALLPDGYRNPRTADQAVQWALSQAGVCLLYTSDAADDLLCVDLGGRRISKKKKTHLSYDLFHVCIYCYSKVTNLSTPISFSEAISTT